MGLSSDRRPPPAPRRRAPVVIALISLLCSLAALPFPAFATAAILPPRLSAASEAVEADWLWPVGGARRIVEPFRAPEHDYGPGHRGMDIAGAAGTPVIAPADGVVAFRGTVVDRPLLTIEHDAGLVSTFEPLDSALSPGDAVAAGDLIGTVATGGHTAAGTLHVGVRLDDRYINPLPLFGDIPRAVLLPCCS